MLTTWTEQASKFRYLVAPGMEIDPPYPVSFVLEQITNPDPLLKE